MKKALLIPIVLMLSLAGCIQNMADLRDRVSGDATTADAVEPAAIVDPKLDDTSANETPKTPPVARMTIFGANGALVFKSTFTAEDPTEFVFVEVKTTIRAIAGDSEVLEPGATLASYAWTLNGEPLGADRQATAELADAGVYTLMLTVTDSHGNSDMQMVKLAVAPSPIDIVTELVTGPVAGAVGVGESGTVTFTLSLDGAGVPATITAVTFKASSPPTCDAILDVNGPEGESLGSKDSTGAGEAEVINAGALAPGDYEIVVGPFACAAPEGVPVTVTVTYLPIVEALAEAGHAHQH